MSRKTIDPPPLEERELIGLYFLTPATKQDGWDRVPVKDRLSWSRQGRVVGRVNDDHYLIQYYSALDGFPNDLAVVSVEDMRGWRFDYYHENWVNRAAGKF